MQLYVLPLMMQKHYNELISKARCFYKWWQHNNFFLNLIVGFSRLTVLWRPNNFLSQPKKEEEDEFRKEKEFAFPKHLLYM